MTATHRKSTRQDIEEARIARRAMELWQRYKRPSGFEAEIWLEAAGDILIEEDKLPCPRLFRTA